MDLDAYQAACRRTARRTSSETEALAYYAMGLVGEATEVLAAVEYRDDECVIEEAGDVAWYAAALADTLGVRLRNEVVFSTRLPRPSRTTAIEIAMSAGALSERVKKVWGHGQLLRHHRPAILASLYDVVDGLARLADGYSTTLSDVLEANVRKLEARYHDGFKPAEGES